MSTIERKRKIKIEKRIAYWTKQLKEVEELRSPTGNWNLLKGLAVLPEKKVQKYFKDRKSRQKKVENRIRKFLKQLDMLEAA